jgi:hypothetical protein
LTGEISGVKLTLVSLGSSACADPDRRWAAGRRLLILAALGGLSLSGLACVDVDGGAVEVDWLVVSQGDGTLLRGCACPMPSTQAIAQVAIALRSRAEGGAMLSFPYACGRGRGTTSFSIPPGDYDISLQPSDASGIDLASRSPPRAYAIPAALVRRIVEGQVASLDVWTVRLDCGS